MFRREMRREERRDVVEVAAVGGVVHETHKANEAEAQLAEAQAQQAEAAPAQAQPEAATPAAANATQPEAAKPAAAEVTDEQVSELERLAKLKEEGILTDEEFAAEKAKILGL
jgi:Short C-terminal domain